MKELADAEYTEEEIKERINAEKKLETFQRLEFGDCRICEVSREILGRRKIRLCFCRQSIVDLPDVVRSFALVRGGEPHEKDPTIQEEKKR